MAVYKAEHNPFEGVQAARWYHHRGMNLVPFSCKHGEKEAIKPWRPWQDSRQPWEAIAHWPWHAGVGAINGVGDWRSIDVDGAHTNTLIMDILDLLGLPLQYPWVVQSGSRTGYHLWFKSEGKPFEGTLYKEEGKSVYVATAKLPQELDAPMPFKQLELRWANCCTILPPTIHPSGQRYLWIHGLPSIEPSCVALRSVEEMMRSLTTIGEKEQEEHDRQHEQYRSSPITIASRRESSQERDQKWAASALENELRILRETPVGNRNNQLNKSAYNLGQIVGGGYLSEREVVSALQDVAHVIGGESPQQSERTIQSGFEQGRKVPRHPKPLTLVEKQQHKNTTITAAQKRRANHASSERANVVPIGGNAGEQPPPRPPHTAVTDEELVEFAASDAGNADAFYALHGSEYLYCSAIGWLHYTGTYWQKIENEIDAKIIEVLRKRRMAAVALEREPVVKATICDMKRVNGCREALKSRCITYTETFDHDPDRLNCQNGVVDLRTGQLFPHHAGQRYTYCIPTEYHSEAPQQEWLAFLTEVIDGGPEMLDYLQMALGYSITGHTSEECLFYLYGPTRSGKGTFTETLLSLFSFPLSNEVDFNVFTSKRDGDTSNFDLAPLRPARLIIASESNKNQSLNPAKIKQLTGGNMVWCSFKHRDLFSYKPGYVTWLASNHKVNGDPEDDALWGRVRVITFPNSFLGHEDRSLKHRMKSTSMREGVLAWAIEGAQKWYATGATGLAVPSTIKEATLSHRAELDHVQQWIDECAELDPETWTSNTEVFESYTTWCRQNLIDEHAKKSQRGLALALQAKGCTTGVQKSFGQFQKPKGVQGLKIIPPTAKNGNGTGW